MKNKHLHITEEQDCQIKQRAKETGLKQAEIIRCALDAYFDDGDDDWDRQIARDYKAGRLDGILAKARKQSEEGRVTLL
jgi:glutamate mutase epsilon subunit